MEKDLDDVLAQHRITYDKAKFIDRMCMLVAETEREKTAQAQITRWRMIATFALFAVGFTLGIYSAQNQHDVIISTQASQLEVLMFGASRPEHFFM